MNRETIQELALEAARYKYKCRECRKRERCTLHTGSMRPADLHCAADDYRRGYLAGYEDAYPFVINPEESEDQEPDYYEVYE